MYKVCIIGCGKIGGNKKKEFDCGKNILTHAHAINKNPKLSLVGVCDIDIEKANYVSKRWGGVAFIKHETLIESIKPDIVIVSVPTELHSDIMYSLATFPDWKPRLVICEKPFCSNTKEAKTISRLYGNINVPIMINYTRRYEKTIHKIKNVIARSKVFSCRIVYNRGLYRDGCHAIDICNYLFGTNQSISKIDADPIIDLSEKDPTYSLHLKNAQCDNIIMTAMDGRIASIFEVDIITSTGRYQLLNFGLNFIFWPITGKNTYGDYPSFSSIPTWSNTDLNCALYEMTQSAVEFLMGNSALLCTDEDAIAVHEIIRKVGKK